MRYRYLDNFRRGISVFAIFSYGIAVLGSPPPNVPLLTCNATFESNALRKCNTFCFQISYSFQPCIFNFACISLILL